MKKTVKIVRFDLQDLNNLEEWEQMDCASLASGEPVQRGRVSRVCRAGIHGWCLGFYNFHRPYDALLCR